MKKIITICAALLISASVFAQPPNKMSYQAVIRNSSNALVTNQSVGMRISILQSSASGSSVYVETQAPVTNTNGLASIEIGGGTAVSGNFANINWANGPYFIKTETDPTGGTNYTIVGTSQLLSVPYALHAKTAASITGTISETDPIFGTSVASGITTNDITNWNNDDVQDGDTTYWKASGDSIFYLKNVGIGQIPQLYNGRTPKLNVFDYNGTNAVLPLRVGRGNNFLEFLFSSSQSNISCWSPGTLKSFNIGTAEPDVFSLYTNNTTRLLIDTLGKVGIGTITPNSRLDVNGAITLSGLGSQSGITTKTNTNDLKLYSGPVGNTSSGIWFRSANVAGDVSAFSELMVIKSTGNVGIGTTNPTRTLHVSSVMRLEPVATAPTSPAKGDMYFDSTLNKLRVYDGTTWQNCW